MSKLILHSTPVNARELVSAELLKIPPRSYGGTDFNQVDIGQLRFGIYFPVFETGIDQDSGDIKIESSHANGGGLLVIDGVKILAAVFVSTAGPGLHVTDIKQITFGPFAENIGNALRDAEHIATNEEFEPRLLRVSSLSTNVLWLASGTDNMKDLYLPIAPIPEFLSHKPYTAVTLAAALSPVSRAIMSAAKRADPGAAAPAP